MFSAIVTPGYAESLSHRDTTGVIWSYNKRSVRIRFTRERELIRFLTKRLTLFLKTHAALPVWAEWPLLFVRERLFSFVSSRYTAPKQQRRRSRITRHQK